MKLFSILVLFVACAGMLYAAEGAPTAAEKPAVLSIQCSEMEVAQALASLSEKAKVSIIPESGLKGTVTMNLSEVTMEQALTAVCKPNKLEWTKVYSTEDAKLDPGKTFTLIETLKALGGSTVMWEDSGTGVRGVYAPKVGSDAGVSDALKLKPVYLVRAEPKPVEVKKTETAKSTPAAQPAPAGSPQAAAQQMWGFMNGMSWEQQRDAMRELMRLSFQNMPEEMRRNGGVYSFQGRGDRDGRRDRNRNGSESMPRIITPDQPR